MEKLHYEMDGGTQSPPPAARPVLIGLVASSNLEVLAEPQNLGGKCTFSIATTVAGFDEAWQAVITDFMERMAPRDVAFSINDFAAIPSIVSLRLDQAWEALLEK